MEKIKDFLKDAFVVVFMVVVPIIVIVTSNVKSNLENSTVYDCDYHALDFLRTTIEVKDSEGNDYATIQSEHVKVLVVDPLVMRNTQNEVIGEAGDKYDFIEQDSHAISIKDEFYIQMSGDFKVFGDLYYLYDANGEKIGEADFNNWGTNGVIKDTTGKTIAEYNSGWLRKDYTVTISNDTDIDTDAILLVFASYASDYAYDND